MFMQKENFFEVFFLYKLYFIFQWWCDIWSKEHSNLYRAHGDVSPSKLLDCHWLLNANFIQQNLIDFNKDQTCIQLFQKFRGFQIFVIFFSSCSGCLVSNDIVILHEMNVAKHTQGLCCHPVAKHRQLIYPNY